MSKLFYTDDELIERMIDFHNDNGRWPKLRDMVSPYPSRSVYAKRFATKHGKQDGFAVAVSLARARYNIRQELYEMMEEIDAEPQPKSWLSKTWDAIKAVFK